MTIFISIISHGHEKLIRRLKTISNLSDSFVVVVKSNKPGDDFNDFASTKNFYWINNTFNIGFSRNNNLVYSFCYSNLGMKSDDFFIILNPDVKISDSDINELIKLMKFDNSLFGTINLFRDKDLTTFDNSIRKFPRLYHFFISFLGLKNTSVIDKSTIYEPCFVDWASGAFLVIKSSHYLLLGGFDEKYFMYCEDIDICYRSKEIGVLVKYYPHIKAWHLGAHASRNIFSKYFYWHVSSVFRFIFTKLGFTRPKSNLFNLNN